MSITASKLGSSPLFIDWSNLNSQTSSINNEGIASAWEQLENRFKSNEVGFFNSAQSDEISQAKASKELASKILNSEKIKDCLFLGIGGSALGPISLLSSLEHLKKSELKFHFVENPDPVDWNLTLSKLNPDTTLVCAVTKSGTTFETISLFMLALNWLTPSRWSENCVAITDPQKGDLKNFAQKNEIPTLHIHPSLGGRFSIFSPVGLFPLALYGLSVDSFLEGAKKVQESSKKLPNEKNPFSIFSTYFLKHETKRPIHVCMPYSTRLRSFANWWVQLWGESLGKDKKGFSPIAAVGATDQHSLLQLLRDGPDDKVTCFITIDQMGAQTEVPRLSFNKMQDKPGSFLLLEGHSLQTLLQVEYQATSLVLAKQERPNFTIQLSKLDEQNLGALYFFFSVLTALTGTLLKVNPFDQPGVEEGKIYIRDSLCRIKESQNTAQYDDSNSAVSRLRRDT